MKHIYLFGLKFVHKLLFMLVYLRINNNNKKNSVEIVNILKLNKYQNTKCHFVTEFNNGIFFEYLQINK